MQMSWTTSVKIKNFSDYEVHRAVAIMALSVLAGLHYFIDDLCHGHLTFAAARFEHGTHTIPPNTISQHARKNAVHLTSSPSGASEVHRSRRRTKEEFGTEGMVPDAA